MYKENRIKHPKEKERRGGKMGEIFYNVLVHNFVIIM